MDILCKLPLFALFIMASARVFRESKAVTGDLPSRNTRRYDRFEATVVVSAHVDVGTAGVRRPSGRRTV